MLFANVLKFEIFVFPQKPLTTFLNPIQVWHPLYIIDIKVCSKIPLYLKKISFL